MDDSHDDHADHEDYPHGDEEEGRVTSPMQDFTTSQVGIGFVVLLVGLAVTFGLPLLF
ncbi:DUF7550 family protein [Haloplanus aerogenes]|uniref:Uncharacterized protein n=1 Tax=Haloplanus aerogenes TaxID=660522 RepID=A0A3M0DZI3_9EURY|nr:hypothetical protein [Haloplanus aerogenes]RMB25296.1 hypothetical protein ATH50_0382 [Haloplanus aerogenes]